MGCRAIHSRISLSCSLCLFLPLFVLSLSSVFLASQLRDLLKNVLLLRCTRAMIKTPRKTRVCVILARILTSLTQTITKSCSYIAMYSVLYNLFHFFLKIWVSLKSNVNLLPSLKHFGSVPSVVYFYSKRIYSYVNFRTVCMHAIAHSCFTERNLLLVYCNSYSNLRFPPRGFERGWRDGIFLEEEDHVHRVSVIGGRASSRKMQCASGAYLRITSRTVPPPIECCTPA